MSTVHAARTTHAPRRGSGEWRRAWPLDKHALWILAKGGLLLLMVWTGAGLLYMALLDDGPMGDADRAGAEWLEDHRTSTLNTLTHYGSMLSETPVKIALIAVTGGIMLVIWRRWHDAVFLVLTVGFESAIFVITSLVVGRDRPPVEQLDPTPPSGSYPSGHAAAAAAFYASLYVIATWHTRNRAIRSTLLVVGVCVPVIVALSRVARGMHHPLDVAAGLLLGVACIFVLWHALAAGVERLDRDASVDPHDESFLPPRARRLDLTQIEETRPPVAPLISLE